ncbi:septation protein SepH [Nocardioides zeae]|uniref:DUF3071 domain-containing protein n=1 Tax=Nocardioides zeae TaxID=1457234 RepID=A0A6P0HM21_9ACTN|nr:septation protein SepH [Nocardioides zeae]NEN79340.1 DUF3071 domain-containing protein [Nocardioides zeae]
MVHLTLAGVSQDKRRLLLVSDAGVEFTLDIDRRLQAALRGDTDRLGQLEITMESTLRPRDIQARIRAGASPEEVADAAQTTLDRIMSFVAPVLAERAHVAERAQGASLRRESGSAGARTLGEAVATHLSGGPLRADTVEWDSWRRDDGRWTLAASFVSDARTGRGHFTYDMRGSYVVADDDDARWLVGDAPAPAAVRDDLQQARRRRAGAARERVADVLLDLPFETEIESETDAADEAIDLVSEPAARSAATPSAATPSAATGDEPTADLGEVRDALRATPPPTTTPPAGTEPREAGGAGGAEVSPAATEPADAPAPSADEAVASDGTPAPDTRDPEPEPAPAPTRTPRRPTRKGRGRASVPSWDEIMFGGGKAE